MITYNKEDITKAINSLLNVKQSEYELDEFNNIISWKSDEKQPTDKEIIDEIKRLNLKEEQDVLIMKFYGFCDYLTNVAKYKITDTKRLSPGQIERYYSKYNVAKKYLDENIENEALNAEADLKNITVKELSELIVNKHNEWLNNLDYFNNLIDIFKLIGKEKIENKDFDTLKKALNKAHKNIRPDITINDIKSFFNN